MGEILVTGIARVYAESIANHRDDFVVGFTDGWHGQPREPLNRVDIMHASNMAYDMGYVIGAQHREAHIGEED